MDTICLRCGATIRARPSARRRYCSRACYDASRPPLAQAERFWRYVRKSDGCWEWLAARKPSGYGTFGLDRETMTGAHRFSWAIHFGPIPPGMFVCHHCDNRACVRPDHLFLGTPLSNTRDMDRKGRRVTRSVHGEANRNSKLTTADIREIRSRRAGGESARALAAEFGVSPPLISYIANRKTWRHVQ